MSEYQYYEWQTVDRLLTEAEQAAVSKLSSHIEVSASRAVVTYSYGDFKHEPRTVLARFFDSHLYLANWGSRRLLFRFPGGLVRREAISPFCIPELITFVTVSGFDILDMDLGKDEGGGWIEPNGSLSGLISLRSDIMQGDFRSLYLAWLKAQSLQDGYRMQQQKSREAKPPIPAGLKQLSSALKRFVQQFEIPAYLIEAASEHSPALAKTVEPDFRPLAAQLTRDECDAFLCRLAQGDISVGPELKRRLLSLAPPPSNAPEERMVFGELKKRAEVFEAAHKKRRREEARRKHEAEMKLLAVCEEDVWHQVVAQVNTKKPKGYEEAVCMLKKLAQLAEFNDSKNEFRRRVAELCERYSRLPGFQSRLQQAKLGK